MSEGGVDGPGRARRPGRGGRLVIELVRLGVVLVLTAVGHAMGPSAAGLVPGLGEDLDRGAVELVSSVLGALVGYVLGGVAGRGLVSGVDLAEARLRRVEAAVLVAAVLGAALTGFLGVLLLLPVLLLPAKVVAVPMAVVVLAVLLYVGGRVGAVRGGDLLRYLGARGRLEVTTPTRGAMAKVVDTSALVDGRLVNVARAGFLSGTLVVPSVVLAELQALADTEDPRRRSAGRRGLDTLRVLQDEQVVAVEITDEDVPEVAEVDAKLAAIARQRQAALVTVDANLSRIAEISGIRVLNLHTLAEALRPPVLPGDRIALTVAKQGRERGQGVGYLPDGTMVVVERAGRWVGEEVAAEVTSLLQTRNGRMVFANLIESTP